MPCANCTAEAISQMQLYCFTELANHREGDTKGEILLRGFGKVFEDLLLFLFDL